MGAMASQTTSLTIVYSTVCSGAYQRKLQSSASLAFVWGIHRWPMNSPHEWPVTRKMFPFDDAIVWLRHTISQTSRVTSGAAVLTTWSKYESIFVFFMNCSLHFHQYWIKYFHDLILDSIVMNRTWMMDHENWIMLIKIHNSVVIHNWNLDSCNCFVDLHTSIQLLYSNW